MTPIVVSDGGSGDHPVTCSEEEEEESVTLHVDDSDSGESDDEGHHDQGDEAPSANTQVMQQRLVHVVSEYDLSASTDPAELQGFQRLTERLANGNTSVIYAGVHLFEADGHLMLASTVTSADTSLQVLAQRRLVPSQESPCYSVIVRNDANSTAQKQIPEGFLFKGMDRKVLYVGRLLQNKNSVGVGTVCLLLNGGADAPNDLTESALTEACQDVSHQLELRRLLMAKNRAAIQVLQEQNRILHHELQSSRHSDRPQTTRGASYQSSKSHHSTSIRSGPNVLLPSFGVVNAVTTEDLARHDPTPHWSTLDGSTRTTSTATESDASTQPPRKPMRSAMLPMFHNENRANEHEQSHLPDDYYALADTLQIDRPPIHKNDRERVAALEALEIHLIQPDEPTGLALKRVTDMATRLFDCDYAEVSFLNHSKGYNIAGHFSCSLQDKAKVCQFKPPMSIQPDNGDPWLCVMDRGVAFCNYVMYTKSTFTLPDVSADESFSWAKDLKFYSASPIVIRGEVVAALCVVDLNRAHPEFTAAHQIQQEQLAQLAAQHIENWVVQRELRAVVAPHPETDDASTGKSLPPEYLAAMVYTGIQGSSALWEANAVAMQEAVALHNHILRDCMSQHHGYEVQHDGDSFQIVFHDCNDAVSFALQAQERLHSAPWSDDILALPDGCDHAVKALRGLRVRMGLHYGPVTYQRNEDLERHEYTGTTVNIAKSLEHMTYGGQITATVDVLKLFSVASTRLQVLDLGRHILLKGTHSKDGIIAKSVVQLVPSSLAFDYASSRTLKEDASANSKTLSSSSQTLPGRRFPPVLSIQRLSASFHEAPYIGNVVTILCLSTTDIETFCIDSDVILTALAKQIGALLSTFHGYQCHDFVVAFATLSDAVTFGLTVQDYLQTHRVAGSHLAGLVAMGIHTGTFVSMSPHVKTGRANYQGTVVQRAARVAEVAGAGKVVVGLMDDEIPKLSGDLDSTYIGSKALKGMEEMDLHVCQWETKCA